MHCVFGAWSLHSDSFYNIILLQARWCYWHSSALLVLISPQHVRACHQRRMKPYLVSCNIYNKQQSNQLEHQAGEFEYRVSFFFRVKDVCECVWMCSHHSLSFHPHHFISPISRKRPRDLKHTKKKSLYVIFHSGDDLKKRKKYLAIFLRI